jgi:BirA family biotin operon repressor/biotin-[acetyl-CoA-carboxylase] ligase
MGVHPVRLAVLETLKQKGPNYVSGEVIAQNLNISRTAIWKHVRSLRRDGYTIESCHRLGYRYKGKPDKLLPTEILHNLKTSLFGRDIIHFQEVSSTQDVARSMAIRGAPEGTLIVAEGQTQGRGRMGRAWISPQGLGLYISLILRPHISPTDAPKMTLMAAVAIANSIEATSSLKAQIKWPNDVLIGGKKVAGVLTEIDAEMDMTHAVILGIGVNVNNEVFPQALRDGVTSLRVETGKEISRLRLLQTLLLDLENLYQGFAKKSFDFLLDLWKKKDITIGTLVKVVLMGREIVGQAMDVDCEGALLLRDEKGGNHRILSGDLTLLRMT